MYSKEIIAGLGMGLAAALALTLPSTAEAGSTLLQEVNIVTSLSKAYGTVQGARYSADSTQRVYCATSSNYGACYARNSSGTTVSCYSSNAEMIAIMRSMTAHSYFTFVWNSSGQCTSVSINNGSDTIR